LNLIPKILYIMNDDHPNLDKEWKRFIFTINNYTDKDLEAVKNLKVNYITVGKEICPTTGTPHLQGYCEFNSKTSIRKFSKKLKRARIRDAKGTCEHNQKYTQKENLWLEEGTPMKQGERTDINDVRDSIMAGDITVDNIAISSPYFYHLYARTLSKLEDLRMRKNFRTEMTKGIWYWGATGTGKSKKAFEGFHPDTHYNWKDDKGWQDGYIQQDTVIINEFRGSLQYSKLLELVDMHPYEVSRRAREPMPFTSKLVIITSALHPKDVYKNLSEHDSLEQLYRRFKIIELKKLTLKNKPKLIINAVCPKTTSNDQETFSQTSQDGCAS